MESIDLVLVIGTSGDAADARAMVPVNGSLRPDFAGKSGERVRLRLVNASAARALAVRLADPAPWVMAIDGQPAEPALARDGRVRLGPGNRIDLFVDMTRAGGTIVPLLMGGGADEQPIARPVYERGGEENTSPRAAPPAAAAQSAAGAHRLALLAQGGTDPCQCQATRSRGSAAIYGPAWTRRNFGDPQYERPSLGRASARPLLPPARPARRRLEALLDGHSLVREQTERIAFVADNPGKWLVDCRMLERHGADARSWFVVS